MMKKIISLLTALCLLLCCAAALAKTTSEAIEAPAGDTVVFTITDGQTTVEFTWDALTAGEEFALSTNEYPAKVDGQQTIVEWTGVMLSDLIAKAVEGGVILPEDAQLEALAADGYTMTLALSDVLDAENLFMVAADPVKNFDGDTEYPNSFVRILRDADASNQANIRCVTGLALKVEAAAEAGETK